MYLTIAVVLLWMILILITFSPWKWPVMPKNFLLVFTWFFQVYSSSCHYLLVFLPCHFCPALTENTHYRNLRVQKNQNSEYVHCNLLVLLATENLHVHCTCLCVTRPNKGGDLAFLKCSHQYCMADGLLCYVYDLYLASSQCTSIRRDKILQCMSKHPLFPCGDFKQ